MAVTWKKLAQEDDVILRSTLDANTILYAVADNTPAALSVGASTIVGRKDTGDIVALNASEGRTVLGLATTDTPQFAGLVAPYIAPAADSTTAVQIRKADATTAVLTVNTTNSNVAIRGGRAPGSIEVLSVNISATNYLYYNNSGTLTLAIPGNQPQYAALGAWVDGDTWLRYAFGLDTGAPFFAFGGGSGARDIYLSRTAAKTFLISSDNSTGAANLKITGGLVVNESGGGAATDDFRVESAGEPDMLSVDANGNTTGLLYLGGRTNGVQVAKGGDLTLLGTAKYTRHIQIPAVTAGSVANQPTAIDFFTVGGLQFSAALAKYAFFQWELPDDWDGTDIYIEVDWFPDSGAMSGTDAVRWTVEYRAIAEGELVNQGTSVTIDNGAGGDTGDHAQYKTVHSRMTLAYNNANQPLTAQDHIFFKVSRDTGVSGDFGGTVTVPAFEIIYTSTGFPTN